jgi:hypothetical protein
VIAITISMKKTARIFVSLAITVVTNVMALKELNVYFAHHLT